MSDDSVEFEIDNGETISVFVFNENADYVRALLPGIKVFTPAMLSQYRDLISNLSPSVAGKLHDWSYHYDRAISGSLRKHVMSQLTRDYVDTFTDLISQMPPVENVVLFRGITPWLPEIENLSPGAVLSDPSFATKSAIADVALNFTRNADDDCGDPSCNGCCLLVIYYPGQSQHVLLGLPEVSHYPHENELMTYPNEKFIIKAIGSVTDQVKGFQYISNPVKVYFCESVSSDQRAKLYLRYPVYPDIDKLFERNARLIYDVGLSRGVIVTIPFDGEVTPDNFQSANPDIIHGLKNSLDTLPENANVLFDSLRSRWYSLNYKTYLVFDLKWYLDADATDVFIYSVNRNGIILENKVGKSISLSLYNLLQDFLTYKISKLRNDKQSFDLMVYDLNLTDVIPQGVEYPNHLTTLID